MTATPVPLLLLEQLYGDEPTMQLLRQDAFIRDWLSVERALARAQAQYGVIPATAADQIDQDHFDKINLDQLWAETRVVGYPILPLVQQLVAALPGDFGNWVHYGATTQDIMDTGLVVRLRHVAARTEALMTHVGDTLAVLVDRHDLTVMAGRTHAQIAAPTTFGAKMAVFLSEWARHRDRFTASVNDLSVVSLHGAAGTSAALGASATQVRDAVAESLELRSEDVPWHVARDRLVSHCLVHAQIAATMVRLAREVIDLSRTEIAEVSEAGGHHRGASSTMPQKANPITCEAVIGLGVAAECNAVGMFRAAEAGHERAAGEWQLEWHLIPQVLLLTNAAIAQSAELLDGLQIDAAQMRRNLDLDHGLVMAEAAMFVLAPAMGRQRAHDAVYEAASQARRLKQPLADILAGTGNGLEGPAVALDPSSAIGMAQQTTRAALQQWQGVR